MFTNKHDEEMTLKMILLSNARSTKQNNCWNSLDSNAETNIIAFNIIAHCTKHNNISPNI